VQSGSVIPLLKRSEWIIPLADTRWIWELIKDLAKARFTGSLTINFSQGGITSLDKKERLAPPVKATLT